MSRDEPDLEAYEVTVSETAEAEASAAYLWHSRRSPEVAGRWYGGLLDAIESLSTFSQRCGLAPENKHFPDIEVRQLIYRQGAVVYRILFAIWEPRTVRVLHVRHGAQQRYGDDVAEGDPAR